jgi:methyl-accepting chemotaxis protein
MLCVTLSIFAVIICVVIGIVVANLIKRPLAVGVETAYRLAAGDLTVNVQDDSKDETPQLMAAMQNMVGNLRDMISKTVDILAGIASASNQLQSTSEQIATGAEEVAAQAGTVATASEEMAATSSDIAQNCTIAADASRQSADAANTGAKVVQETITRMNIIADRVRQTATTIETFVPAPRKLEKS